jgi:deoxyribonuclease V
MIGMKNKITLLVHRHRWDVRPQRARAIQDELRRHWEGEDRLPEIRTVAGLDAAFVLTESQSFPKRSRWNLLRDANRAIGCVVMYRFPEMQEIERAYAVLPLKFPYIPGFLSFREIPVLLAALGKLHEMPDLLFCDGQGIAHPRRLGLAAHLGIVLGRPTIGCAKSLLIGTPGKLAAAAGSWAPLVDEDANGECIGATVRTRTGVKPIYVSPGNRVSLASSIRLTLAVTDGHRVPQPTRDADRFASEIKRKLLAAASSEK